MTAKPILARYDRLRTAFRSRSRSYNLANVFLVCCIAADTPTGILATPVADHVGMCVRNARDLLARLTTLGLLTVRHESSKRGGRPGGIYYPTPALFTLLGIEKGDTVVPPKCQPASDGKAQKYKANK